MTVDIVISTRNRAGEMQRTLQQLRLLDPRADKVSICLDGCQDRTASVIQELCPEAGLIIHDQAKGSVQSRHELISGSSCDLAVSLDDDSYPLQPDFVDAIKRQFKRNPKLAVLTFAQRSEEFPESLHDHHFGVTEHRASYGSGAAAIRRSAFLAAGGYPGFFFHAYEEPDFAIRCLAAGYEVRYDPSLVIRHHFTATGRNELRTHQFHSRNEQWSIWMRCPWPWWPLISIRRAAGQFRYACKRGPGWAVREPVWWAKALAGFARAWQHRNPVPWGAYCRWMHLLRRPEPVAQVRETRALGQSSTSTEGDS